MRNLKKFDILFLFIVLSWEWITFDDNVKFIILFDILEHEISSLMVELPQWWRVFDHNFISLDDLSIVFLVRPFVSGTYELAFQFYIVNYDNFTKINYLVILCTLRRLFVTRNVLSPQCKHRDATNLGPKKYLLRNSLVILLLHHSYPKL